MAEVQPGNPPALKVQSGVFCWLDRLATVWALLGGALFIVLVGMSIVSIVGRKLFSAPVTGDMELLMMGAAVGSAAFLPICEMADQHIRIDALTAWASARLRGVLDAVAHGLLGLFAALIAWRTTLYALDAHEYQEVSILLKIPLWLPVSLLVPSFILLALAAVYRVRVSLGQVFAKKGVV